MKSSAVVVPALVEVPTTRAAWELYDMPGAGTAARALTSALRKAVKAVAKGSTAVKAMDEIWYPVASKYASFGATDTEPRWHAQVALEKAQALTSGRSS